MDLDPVYAALHRESVELERLIDFAFELGAKDVRRCKHHHSTVVQMMLGDEHLVTRQCDDCGITLANGEITPEQLSDDTLPWFEPGLLDSGSERMATQQENTASFFGRTFRQ